jgi:adenylate kinase family enzyme
MKIISIIGLPGSGKGTLCKKLTLKYNCLHLSAGDLLRQTKDEDIMKYLNKGKLVPAKIICDLLNREIKKYKGDFVLLDGFPRSIDNLETFEELNKIDFIINLSCKEKTVVARLLNRNDERNDDNIEVIKKRIKIYNEQIELIKTNRMIHNVDTDTTIDEVLTNISELFKSFQLILENL